MAERGKYRTPAALRAAIEARLRERSRRRGTPYARVQLLFLMDRVMARLSDALGDRAILKGGLALELRLEDVRTTRDIDLRVEGAAPDPLDLRRAGQLDLGDRFSFDIEPASDHPKIAGPGVRYEGTRYRVKPRFAGKDYGRAFGLDVAVGGVLTGRVDSVQGDGLLSFVGLEPRVYRLLPRETHVAEKLHAYTMPREGLNSRVKDLPDLALLAGTGPFDADAVRRAIDRTFQERATHEVPTAFPAPPPAWETPYATIAAEDGLPWPSLAAVFIAAAAFVDGAIRGGAAWNRDDRAWETPGDGGGAGGAGSAPPLDGEG